MACQSQDEYTTIAEQQARPTRLLDDKVRNVSRISEQVEKAGGVSDLLSLIAGKKRKAALRRTCLYRV